MTAEQLGYSGEEYNGVYRFVNKGKGITIYINLNVAGYNASVDIRLPAEGYYCSLRGRVNDAEEVAILLTKAKIIADTLRCNN